MGNSNNSLIVKPHFSKRDYLNLLFIGVLYLVFKIPEVFCFPVSGLLVHYADFDIQAGLLLGDGWLPKAELNGMYISPVTPYLIIPPGIYYIQKIILNVVGGTYSDYALAIFLFQMMAPLLTYILGRYFLNKNFSLILAVLSVACFTPITIMPDNWIQPIMLVSLIFLMNYFICARKIMIFMVGVFIFIIIFLKHNVGINYLIAISMSLVVRNLGFKNCNDKGKDEADASKYSVHYFLFMVPLVFVMYRYWSIYLYKGEIIFYLLPPIIFFVSLSAFVIIKRNMLTFDMMKMLKETVLMYSPIIGLSIIWITVYSQTFGFSEYIYSLFGMGIQYLPIWDEGILNYFKFRNIVLQSSFFLLLGSILMMEINENSITKYIFNITGQYINEKCIFRILCIILIAITIVSVFFLKYFNIGYVGKLLSLIPQGLFTWDYRNYLICLSIAVISAITINCVKNTADFERIALFAIPVIGIWMYFPLESDNIFKTKSFLFLLPFLIYFQSEWNKKSASRCLLVLSIIGMLYLPVMSRAHQYSEIFDNKYKYIMNSDNKNNIMLKNQVADEFAKSIEVAEKHLKNEDFMVIDSTSTLRRYYSFLNTKTKNYFIETRDGLVDNKIEELLKENIDSKFNYIMIYEKNYDNINPCEGKYTLCGIAKYIRENSAFEVVDRYKPPEKLIDDHLLGFYILKRKELIKKDD